MSRHVFAVLALLALGAAVGLWYVFNQTKVETLKLGAGMELKYREGLTDILCDEAKGKDLKIEIQWNPQPLDAIQRVERHELDAAIIPAGLSGPRKKVRQVTMLDCETLHLFVKPEICQQGLAGLRGHSIFMGPPGTGVRCVAEEILAFIGLTGGKDFVVDSRGYEELMKSPDAMPDAIFSLSPLPSPLGEKLARQFGYQLLELPMGEALSLRKPCFEDILIPADTYSASPAVPQKQIHSIGVRGVLIAHHARAEHCGRAASGGVLRKRFRLPGERQEAGSGIAPAVGRLSGPSRHGRLYAPRRPLADAETADQAPGVHRLDGLGPVRHSSRLALDPPQESRGGALSAGMHASWTSTPNGPPARANSARPS